jgi:hypothetical protein
MDSNFWTDVNIEWVLSEWKDIPIKIPNWISFIVTIVFNGFTVLFNIICEVIKLVK